MRRNRGKSQKAEEEKEVGEGVSKEESMLPAGGRQTAAAKLQPKRGRPKKSDYNQTLPLQAAVVAAAEAVPEGDQAIDQSGKEGLDGEADGVQTGDVEQRNSAPGDQSVQEAAKRKRGRPKKSSEGIEQSTPIPATPTGDGYAAKQKAEEPLPITAQPESARRRSGRGAAKGVTLVVEAQEINETVVGERQSVSVKVKSTRVTKVEQLSVIESSPAEDSMQLTGGSPKKSLDAELDAVKALAVKSPEKNAAPGPIEEQGGPSELKRKRGRPKKAQANAPEAEVAEVSNAQGDLQNVTDDEQQAKRAKLLAPVAGLQDGEPAEEHQSDPSSGTPVDNKEKRKRGRPSKSPKGGNPVDSKGKIGAVASPGRRGRPKKSEAEKLKVTAAAVEQSAEEENVSNSVEANGDAKERSRSPRRGAKKRVHISASPSPNDGKRVLRSPKKSSTEKFKALSPTKGRTDSTKAARQSVDGNEKRKRGRPKAIDKEKQKASSGEAAVSKEKRGRGRPKLSTSNGGTGLSNAVSPAKANGASKSKPTGKYSKSLRTAEIDGEQFKVGDDVYVKKNLEADPDSEAEAEDCRICGTVGEDQIMLECDYCLAGYHLTCIKPPLDGVPDGDWKCSFCEAGEKPPQSKTGYRTARERFLAGELWAARIERMWKAPDGALWFTARWFIVPEDTSMGRQAHNGSREVYRSNRKDDTEMETILKHCHVLTPRDFKTAKNEGDDVYYCGYEFNEQLCRYKPIEYLDDKDEDGDGDDELGGSDSEEETTGRKRRRSSGSTKKGVSKTVKAANKGGAIDELGAKGSTDGVRKQPANDFDRAKLALALSAVPATLPCRERERQEITTFLTDSIGAGEECLGRCLYISGVPGTGKTATVLEVIKELQGKVDSEQLPPYRFVEINGLRLQSPEDAYTVIHEALTGQHVSWKKSLHLLDERFSNGGSLKGVDARPCVLLVDELDLLVNRNQSVLYNIFDWPSRPQSRLIVIGIANTIDLPERMLPKIASRMGVHRISFSPYTHKELEEIISARLTGIQVFDKQAAEFASRKVAAVSGDVRRALELCRKAVEVAEARLQSTVVPSTEALASSDPSTSSEIATARDADKDGELVTIADVDAAIAEMLDAPQIQMMRRFAKLWKIFLVAMVHQQKKTAKPETTFETIAATCTDMCTSNGEESPDWDTLVEVGGKLGTSKLLLCEPGALHRLQKLQLNVSSDDVSFALKSDGETPWLAKYL